MTHRSGATSEEALEIVSWYASEDPDPREETWRTKPSSGGVNEGRDMLTAAINSVRGTAAEAVAQLIFADGDRLSYFRPILERMVEDPSIAVRSCAALTLT